MQTLVRFFSELYPWPERKPEVPSNWHGWFSEPNQTMLRGLLSESTRVIVELGAWCGVSTKFLLDQAPNATVISIDHWLGSKEHQKEEFSQILPNLYETFLVNLWDDRKRLIPLRANTVEGLENLHQWRICVDLTYIDASHEYEEVFCDIKTAIDLFPNSTICGDDWSWGDVRRAVEEISEIKQKTSHTLGEQVWWFSNSNENNS